MPPFRCLQDPSLLCRLIDSLTPGLVIQGNDAQREDDCTAAPHRGHDTEVSTITATSAAIPDLDLCTLAHEAARGFGAYVFIQPIDLSSGNPRLMQLFVAQLFKVRNGFSLDEALLPMGEATAFAQYVNTTLWENDKVNHLLPLGTFTDDLFESLQDGFIIAELVNFNRSSVVQMELEHLAWQTEEDFVRNVTAALGGALHIGCDVSRVNPLDVVRGR